MTVVHTAVDLVHAFVLLFPWLTLHKGRKSSKQTRGQVRGFGAEESREVQVDDSTTI